MDLEGLEPSPATMTGCYAAITPQAHIKELKSVEPPNVASSLKFTDSWFLFGKTHH